VIVYLLAAGYATRLWPLTRDRPKPLLEVGGAPLLTHLVRRFEVLADVEEIVVIGNARFGPQLEAWRSALRARVPVRLLDDGSSSDDDKLGAIGDLHFAVERVPPAGRPFAVAAGDNLIAFDLRPLQTAFRAHDDPLLALRTVAIGGGPSPYNEVTLDGSGRVVGFREKPRDPRTDLAAIALYFFPPRVEDLLHAYVAAGNERDAPGHLIAWLVKRTTVRGMRFEGPWFDVGSFETLARARAALGGGEADA